MVGGNSGNSAKRSCARAGKVGSQLVGRVVWVDFATAKISAAKAAVTVAKLGIFGPPKKTRRMIYTHTLRTVGGLDTITCL